MSGGFFDEPNCPTGGAPTGGFFTDACDGEPNCAASGGFYVDFCGTDPNDPCAGGGPTPPDACLIWACDEFSNIWTEQTIGQFQTSLETFPPEGDWAWPFAPDRPAQWGHPTLFTSWTSYIAAPNPMEDWGGYIQKSNTSSWDWDPSILKFCDLEANAFGGQMMDIECNTSVVGTSVPTDLFAKSESFSGNMTITGHRGTTTMNMTLWRESQARYQLWKDGNVSAGQGKNEVYLTVADMPGATDAEKRITLTVGDAGGVSTGFIDIPRVDRRWVNITWTEQSSCEIFDNLGDNDFKVSSTVNITVTLDDGTVQTLSVSGFKEYQVSGGNATSFELIDNTSIYNCPRFFWGSASFQRLSVGQFGVSLGVIDHAAISAAFLRNLTTYVDPRYPDGCNYTLPPCEIYTCDSLDTYLTNNGYTSVAMIKGATFDYPFAETRPESYGHPTDWTAWTNFIAGPTSLPSFNSTYVRKVDITGEANYDDFKYFVDCDALADAGGSVAGALATQICDVEGANQNTYAITLPTSERIAAESSTRVIGFCGRGAGTSGLMELTRQPASRYILERTDGDTFSAQVSLFINLQSSDIAGKRIRITAGSSGGAGYDNTDIELGVLDGMWTMVVTEHTWTTIDNGAGPPNPATCTIWVEWKVTVKRVGDYPSQTATGISSVVFEEADGNPGWASAENYPPTDLYDCPRFHYALPGYSVGMWHLSYKANTGFNEDHVPIINAIEQNNKMYRDDLYPDGCVTLPPP